MKILKILFVLVFIGLSSSTLFSQNPFDNVGNTWVYNMHSNFSLLYNRYTIEKDTIVDGLDAKKISITEIEFNGIPGPPDTETELTRAPDRYLGYWIFRTEGDSVFWHDDNGFKFLYDLSPQVNDQWNIQGVSFSFCSNQPNFPDTDIFTVTEIIEEANIYLTATDIINLDMIYLENQGYWTLGSSSTDEDTDQFNIIVGVGPTASIIPQISGINCSGGIGSPIGRHASLVCTNFSEFSYPASNCQDLMSFYTDIEDIPEENYSISIYPNPSNDILHFSLDSNYGNKSIHLNIYDAMGRQMINKHQVNDHESFNVSQWANGMYFVQVFSGQKILYTQKIIIQHER